MVRRDCDYITRNLTSDGPASTAGGTHPVGLQTHTWCDACLRCLVMLMKFGWAAGCGQSAVGWHFSPPGSTMMSRAGTTGSISRRAGGSSTSIRLLHCCSASRTSCPPSAYRYLNAVSVGTSWSVTPVSRDVWTHTGRHTAPVRWQRRHCWRSVHICMDQCVESEQCQHVTSRPRILRKFHGAKVLGTFAPKQRKFHGCKSSKERKFLDFSLIGSECSTERMLLGLFAPGNESAEERKVQIPDTAKRKPAGCWFAVTLSWAPAGIFLRGSKFQVPTLPSSSLSSPFSPSPPPLSSKFPSSLPLLSVGIAFVRISSGL